MLPPFGPFPAAAQEQPGRNPTSTALPLGCGAGSGPEPFLGNCSAAKPSRASELSATFTFTWPAASQPAVNQRAALAASSRPPQLAAVAHEAGGPFQQRMGHRLLLAPAEPFGITAWGWLGRALIALCPAAGCTPLGASVLLHLVPQCMVWGHLLTSPCPPAGTPFEDTQCRRCPRGFFSSSSSTEPCQPHQDCAQQGKVINVQGNEYHDTLCTSCRAHGRSNSTQGPGERQGPAELAAVLRGWKGRCQEQGGSEIPGFFYHVDAK